MSEVPLRSDSICHNGFDLAATTSDRDVNAHSSVSPWATQDRGVDLSDYIPFCVCGMNDKKGAPVACATCQRGLAIEFKLSDEHPNDGALT